MLSQRDGLLGWATAQLVAHDGWVPGVIARLLTAGPMHRQAVFMIIAHELVAERHHQINDGEDEIAAIARAKVLRDGRARDVIALLTGAHAPEGLLGALERIGLSPFHSFYTYVRLMSVFRDPAMRYGADALRHVAEITSPMINAISILPTWLLSPQVLRRLDNSLDAHGFVEAVAFVQRVNSKATTEVIAGAIAAMRPETTLPDLLMRLVRRADQPFGRPFPPTTTSRPLPMFAR